MTKQPGESNLLRIEYIVQSPANRRSQDFNFLDVQNCPRLHSLYAIYKQQSNKKFDRDATGNISFIPSKAQVPGVVGYAFYKSNCLG